MVVPQLKAPPIDRAPQGIAAGAAIAEGVEDAVPHNRGRCVGSSEDAILNCGGQRDSHMMRDTKLNRPAIPQQKDDKSIKYYVPGIRMSPNVPEIQRHLPI